MQSTNDIPPAFNSDCWVTELTRHLGEEWSKDRHDPGRFLGRTRTWLAGWSDAWTHAYVVLCSVLESSYCHPDSMLRIWVNKNAASSAIPRGSVVVRRWKNREDGSFSHAISTSWSGVSEMESDDSQYLIISNSQST